jgi:hypothetical protein
MCGFCNVCNFRNMCTCIYCFLYCFNYVYVFLIVLSLLPPSDNSVAVSNITNTTTANNTPAVYNNSSKRQTDSLDCMNVSLLHSNQRHVSAYHMAIFRAVRTRIQLPLQSVAIRPQFAVPFISSLTELQSQFTTRSLYVQHPKQYITLLLHRCYLYVYSILFHFCHCINIYSNWRGEQFCSLSLNMLYILSLQ